MDQKISDTKPSANVDLIAADIDFKPYLEAANVASQRTRSTIYVLIVALVMIFTAFRNTTYPDWLDARLVQFQKAAVCVKAQSTTEECQKVVAYARGFYYNGDESQSLYGEDFAVGLQRQVNEFIRARTEALSLRLPFFGVVIDMNDLGILGGIFLASILYMLNAALYREVDNLERAKRKAASVESPTKQQENLELLFMSQVLASKKGKTYGVLLLLFLVVVMQLIVLISDIQTRETAAVLQGSGWAWFETILDFIFFVIVLVMSIRCFSRQGKLDDSIDDLISKIE